MAGENRDGADRVLNAFRHLMKDHSDLDLLERTGMDVLNAFRHLMKDHRTTRRTSPRFARVLNAFRHLMKDHVETRHNCDRPKLCSTPFGI